MPTYFLNFGKCIKNKLKVTFMWINIRADSTSTKYEGNDILLFMKVIHIQINLTKIHGIITSLKL